MFEVWWDFNDNFIVNLLLIVPEQTGLNRIC